MATPSHVPELLGHYRIGEKIGAGGMGEVYRASDDRLDRDVAIKLLPCGTIADESARKRFRKEALALSKLNHPNIETVYDFDTLEGLDFLVMEFVPGVTLSDTISAGPMAECDVLKFGSQLAEGLVAAHEKNIVHRDLKPANLRITPDGRLKILDFGLATLVPSGVGGLSTATLTEVPAAGGTLPYMAPEQLQGRAPDVRSDIWATGVVLYEMATGALPFSGKLPTAVADGILHQPTRPPSRLNANISMRLEDVILKCLEKDPANRYQSSKELLVDLRRLVSASSFSFTPVVQPSRLRRHLVILAAILLLAATLAAIYFGRNRRGARGTIDSIAVLPLANRSQDPEQEYFADGVTESLITELSRIKALKVISMTSAMHYKGASKTVPQIAQELGVGAIVEGSVTRIGEHVRVTANLIDARTDRQLWSETYDRDVRDVLNLETELARDIGDEIRVTVTPREKAHLGLVRSVIPEAHEAYVKGLYFANRSANTKSIEWFGKAIAIDPNYAPAYAGLAQQYAFKLPANEYMPKAKAAAVRAIELDDSLAEAHIALGTVAVLYEWQWAEGEKELKRALDLDPSSASAHSQQAYFLTSIGRSEEAVAEAAHAQRVDPLSLWVTMNYGRVLYFARRYDEAAAQFKKTLELDPNFAMGWFFLGITKEQQKRYAEGIADIIKARELGGDKQLAAILTENYARGGYIEALRSWANYWEEGTKDGTVQPTSVAMLYARIGEKDKAFQYLEQGFREHTRSIVYIKSEPQWDNLRSDPRFADLIRRMGLPQ